MTVKRVRRRTLPRSCCCMFSNRSVTHCSLPKERSTALCSIPSWTCICMRLSSRRMSSVIWRNLLAISFPNAKVSGVSSSSAQANRGSNQRISRKAPMSCNVVISMEGSTPVVTLLTVSISLVRREVTSPECSSRSSKSWRWNKRLKASRRMRLVCRTPAVTDM